jgi:hypothetical protein
MARIRSVYPDICTDETLALCSPRAERTFVRLWTHLDDAGRCIDNPLLIKAALYPLHETMTADEVATDLAELEDLDLIFRYVADGKKILAAKPESWTARQKPRHPSPSKLPEPPEHYGVSPEDDSEAPHVVVEVGVDVEGDVDVDGPPGGASDDDPRNDHSVTGFVASYCLDYRTSHNGHAPSEAWRGMCGKAVKAALKDGETSDVIRKCLTVIARENKAPSLLGHVISDYHREVAS